MDKIPTIKVLEGIKPANAGKGDESLVYANIGRSVAENSLSHLDRSHAFWDSETGSIDELSKAHQLAAEYLLRTSLKAINSDRDNNELWAKRFTDSAVELYGEPEKSEAISLMIDDFTFFESQLHNRKVDRLNLNKLLNYYWGILRMNATSEQMSNGSEQRTSITEATKKYGEFLKEKYNYIFDLVESSEIESYGPSELLEVFSESLNLLASNDDESWSEWSAELKEGTSISVTANTKKINIASSRALASKKDVKGLLAHELLTHALRSKNGANIGDEKMTTGLPQYLDAEEGLGILSEFAVTGDFPEKARERYIDIAIALGKINGRQMSRLELFEISFCRAKFMNELTDNPVELDELKKSTWTHIDRIYRGGRGDSSTSNQAVFSKDIAYYEGYRKMRDYIDESFSKGESIEDIFKYLLMGKFDPTNPVHVNYVKQVTAS